MQPHAMTRHLEMIEQATSTIVCGMKKKGNIMSSTTIITRIMASKRSYGP
jgi:hypothetical protein